MNEKTKRLILITGGTSGIGLAAAACVSRDGYTPVLLGRNPERGREAERKVQGSRYIPCDVTSTKDINRAVKEAEAIGRIEGLVAAAGQYAEGLVENIRDEDMENLFRVNVFGVIASVRAVIPVFRKYGRGSIVVVSSDAAVQGNIQGGLYSATKGAVTAFARSAALELAVEKVRINVVCPGDIKTPLLKRQFAAYGGSEKETAELYPLMRIGRPEEVGEVISFLLSDRASFMTGSVVMVDGGLTDW